MSSASRKKAPDSRNYMCGNIYLVILYVDIINGINVPHLSLDWKEAKTMLQIFKAESKLDKKRPQE